ncbi:hypothetical protein [Ornithinibacillus xuwenensis]|uniref:Uncharacterized protein n=1 Tax=Ornithinibacillus xuwenensis TaxID=3144668 RepID=A0ABU9XBM1_9BACI
MSEWLTTGKMIDNLKVGQVAVSVSVPHGEALLSDKVILNENILVWKDNNRKFIVNDFTKDMKWVIVPNYVTFENAMQAVEEDKLVHFHPKENDHLIVRKEGTLTWFAHYYWKDLIDGKWTIEG